MKLNVEETAVLSPEPGAAILALDEALQELAKIAPLQAKVVELRYLGALSGRKTVGGIGRLGADGNARLGVRQGLAIASTDGALTSAGPVRACAP